MASASILRSTYTEPKTVGYQYSSFHDNNVRTASTNSELISDFRFSKRCCWTHDTTDDVPSKRVFRRTPQAVIGIVCCAPSVSATMNFTLLFRIELTQEFKRQ